MELRSLSWILMSDLTSEAKKCDIDHRLGGQFRVFETLTTKKFVTGSHILLKIVSENQFSGRPTFIQLSPGSTRNSADTSQTSSSASTRRWASIHLESRYFTVPVPYFITFSWFRVCDIQTFKKVLHVCILKATCNMVEYRHWLTCVEKVSILNPRYHLKA